jgi:hypothetical protein
MDSPQISVPELHNIVDLALEQGVTPNDIAYALAREVEFLTLKDVTIDDAVCPFCGTEKNTKCRPAV